MADGETAVRRPDFVEVRLQRARDINFRAWLYPFVALPGLLVLLAMTHRESIALWPRLGLLLAYMSVAFTFCPLPTAWFVMLAASPAGLDIDPWLTATVATLGTCVANMHDYYVVTFFYRYRPIRRVRRTGLYRKAAAWFERAPFATLTAASFLPIPIDFVRLLAISQAYPRSRFASASILGRWPRYFALAFFAERFSLGWQWILATLGVAVVFGLWHGLPPLVRTLKGFRRKELET